MNCSTDKTSELHSVVFKTDPPNRWTSISARKWLKDHNIQRLKSVDITKNSLRYRIVDPKCFVSFSTNVVQGPHGTINLVIGWYVKRPKGGGRHPHTLASSTRSSLLKRKKIKKSTLSSTFRKTVKKRKQIFLNRKGQPVGGSLHY